MKNIAILAALAVPLLLGGQAIAESRPATSKEQAQPLPPQGADPGENERMQQRQEWRLHMENMRREAEQRREQAALRRFEIFDTNKDGSVSLEEAIGVVREKFNEIDKDKDGFVSMSEIEAAVAEMRSAAGRPGARHGVGIEPLLNGAMFRYLDSNKDAKIGFEEVRPMVEGIFRAFDANSDGRITRDEQDFLRPPGRRAAPQ